MRILILSLLLCFYVSRGCITVRAEGEQTNPSRSGMTIDKAIRAPGVNLIAVAALVKLGDPDSPKTPEVQTYSKAEFEVIRVLKGKDNGGVQKILYREALPPLPGLNYAKEVQEKHTYIIICVTSADGGSEIIRVLPDDTETEKYVAAAITRLDKAPPILLRDGMELKDALAFKEVGLIALATIANIKENGREVSSFEGDFEIKKVLRPQENGIANKKLHLIGQESDLPAGLQSKGTFIIICSSIDEDHILKMFPDDDKTERNIATALAAVKKRATLHPEPTEMWVVPLEHKIPSKSPDGRKVVSLGFVVRVRGTGEYTTINFFNDMFVWVIDSSGKLLPDLYHGSIRLPTREDIIALHPNEVIEKAYRLFLQNDTLDFFDLDGNAHHFQGVARGKYRVEVLFDDTRAHRLKEVAKLEDDYESGEEPVFFRGPLKMSFEIEIGDIEKK